MKNILDRITRCDAATRRTGFTHLPIYPFTQSLIEPIFGKFGVIEEVDDVIAFGWIDVAAGGVGF